MDGRLKSDGFGRGALADGPSVAQQLYVTLLLAIFQHDERRQAWELREEEGLSKLSEKASFVCTRPLMRCWMLNLQVCSTDSLVELTNLR